jgi:hypothetical protein
MTAWDKIMNEDYDLYASSVKILGTNVIFPKSSPKISLLNSIFENTTIGSTMVFNQRILESVIHIDNDFLSAPLLEKSFMMKIQEFYIEFTQIMLQALRLLLGILELNT